HVGANVQVAGLALGHLVELVLGQQPAAQDHPGQGAGVGGASLRQGSQFLQQRWSQQLAFAQAVEKRDLPFSGHDRVLRATVGQAFQPDTRSSGTLARSASEGYCNPRLRFGLVCLTYSSSGTFLPRFRVRNQNRAPKPSSRSRTPPMPMQSIITSRR